MKIGIDARKILSPEKNSDIGVGHYTYQLIRHLLEIDRENEYVLFFDFKVREKDIKKFSQSNVKIKFYPYSDYKKYMPGFYSEILGTATLAKEKLDVVHATSPTSRIPSSYRGETMVTIHDLASYKLPSIFSKVSTAKFKATTSLMTKKADKIIAVSDSTKEDVCNLLGCCSDEKVKVVYGGVDKRFFHETQIDRERFLKKYAIENRYILFLGTLEPVKNIARMFESFKLFKEKLKRGGRKNNYKLVMAGKRGWMAKEYKQMAKDLGISKDVIFTGYVIGDEMVPFFKHAEFFVMPSLYEGFGSTILEAFATGTPAIVSNVSSVPEIAGEGARLVDPMNTEEISNAMTEFAKNESLRDEYRQKGFEQVRKFTWEKCARETLEIYKSFKKE